MLKQKKYEHSENLNQDAILQYLDFMGGFPCKIELSGKPVIKKGFVILIPFKNKYYRLGMSDVLYFFKGKFFAFEIKKESEYKYYLKKIDYIKNTPIELIPKKDKKLRHLKNQHEFIQNIKKQGGHGDFVWNVSQVKLILNKAFNLAK